MSMSYEYEGKGKGNLKVKKSEAHKTVGNLIVLLTIE
jgi:hypothetical protein